MIWTCKHNSTGRPGSFFDTAPESHRNLFVVSSVADVVIKDFGIVTIEDSHAKSANYKDSGVRFIISDPDQTDIR